MKKPDKSKCARQRRNAHKDRLGRVPTYETDRPRFGRRAWESRTGNQIAADVNAALAAMEFEP